MMVAIKNWKPGFNKVRFNKLMQEYAGCSLSEAKKNVDKLLGGEELHLAIEESRSEEFKALAKELGAEL
jgi:ribosomal protein L7/L12